MRPLIRLLFLAGLLPLNLFAQSFYPGYAIKNNGDTLKGYLKFKRWENNPDGTQFKPGAQDKPINLTKSNTRYFSIDVGSKVEFQRYAGAVSTDVVNINDLDTYRDSSFRMDTVFLKVLRKGPNVQLFSYDDNLKTRYFIADGPDFNPVELTYRIYYNIDSVGNKKSVREDTYKKQLYKLALKYGKDNNDLNAAIYKSDYIGANIIDVTDKINGFTSKDIPSNSELTSPPKTKLVLMLGVFVTVAILTFSVMHK